MKFWTRQRSIEKKAAILKQQSLSTENVIHLWENEKSVRLQIISILMSANFMFLCLKRI